MKFSSILSLYLFLSLPFFFTFFDFFSFSLSFSLSFSYFLYFFYRKRYNFGGLIANLLVVGSAVPPLLQKISGHNYFLFHRQYPQLRHHYVITPWPPRIYVLVFTAVILLPVTFFKNISVYAYASFFTVLFFLASSGIFLFLGVQFSIDDHFNGMFGKGKGEGQRVKGEGWRLKDEGWRMKGE